MKLVPWSTDGSLTRPSARNTVEKHQLPTTTNQPTRLNA